MKEKNRIIIKIMIILFCTFSLLWLIHKDETVLQLKQPQGEGIATEHVFYLTEAVLNKMYIWDEDVIQQKRMQLELLRRSWESNGTEQLLYDNYIEIEGILGTSGNEAFAMENKYKKGFYVLREDWYAFYDMVVKNYQLENEIIKENLNILTDDSQLPAQKAGEKCILTADGKRYQYLTEDVLMHRFEMVTAYTTENTILSVVENTRKSFTIDNVWVMENNGDSIQFFVQGFEVVYFLGQEEVQGEITRESVADLTFDEGGLSDIKEKKHRIGGRILRLTEEEIELEGYGHYQIENACKVYRLYEELQEESIGDLKIGYDFADFVIEDGKVCAVLIVRKENMESIRVAIRNDNFVSLYHEEIRLMADCEVEVVYGEYDARTTVVIPQGEEICLNENSDYIKGDRVIITPKAQSGKIGVSSIKRNQKMPFYRGSMEIVKAEKGLLMINELLLEEYLYSVVPSEMPASYPTEALKAQAICARTYAYQYLNAPGLREIGANVDDSVGYQVYNNIEENSNSTKAVKETTGQILFYGNEVVNTYYYSTSCGFGADAGVWQEENVQKYPYLTSRHIAKTEEELQEMEENNHSGQITPQNMQEEECIKEYLSETGSNDYEREEPWYRWSYTAEDIDAVYVWERLRERFEADGSKIITCKDESGETKEGDLNAGPEKFTEIYGISVLKRREGGVIDELLLNTDSGNYKIISEYNVRYILNHGGSVIRQDESKVSNGQILPSAYFVMELEKEDDIVTGYKLTGGGYGHGVGMSQNGAKAMAGSGMDSSNIIAFYYPSCELRKVY